MFDMVEIPSRNRHYHCTNRMTLNLRFKIYNIDIKFEVRGPLKCFEVYIFMQKVMLTSTTANLR